MNNSFLRATSLAGVVFTTTCLLTGIQAAPTAPKTTVKPVASKPAAPKVTAPKAVSPKATAKPVAPKPTAPKPVAAAKPAAPKAAVVAAKPSAPAQPVAPSGEKLPNGVTLVSSIDRISPRFSASILLRVGAADENTDTAGWRRLLVNAMLRRAPRGYGSEAVPSEAGAAAADTEELANAAQALGGEIGASVGDDTVEVWVTGDSTNSVKLLQLALDLIRKPRLEDADLDKARDRQRDQLDAEDLDVPSRISGALRGQLFRTPSGEVTAYGLPDYGTQASIQNLTNEKLRALYRNTLLPARLTVSVAGDVDMAGTRNVLESWAPGVSREPTKPVFAPPKPGSPLVVRELQTNSAWVFISYPVGEVSAADAPTLRVIAAILGDMKAAKLPTRLLGTPLVQGAPVALSVSSQWLSRRYASEILISTQTSSQSVNRAKDIVLDEVRKLGAKDLAATDLANAKSYALGSWSLERQSLRDRAFSTGLSPALGGPYDSTLPSRLSAVTAADVKRVAQKYFKNYTVALVMPREE